MAVRHVLAIDGGGVRGIVAAVMIDALEAERRAIGATRPLGDCFDLIAGTSTGAIIAGALAAPNPQGDGPLRTPTELRDLYRRQASRIFPRRFFCRIPVIGRLRQFFGPLFSNEPLDRILNDEFGALTFSGLRRNLYVATYGIDPRGAAIFRGGPDYAANLLQHEPDPDLSPFSQNVSVAEAVSGSTAAPTFFPPRIVRDPDSGIDHTVIDGGVFLNDPSLAAYTDARSLYPDDDIHVVSFGTGRIVEAYPFSAARSWGFLEWLSPVGRFRTPLISAITDGQARAVHKQMKSLLGDRYHRFDYDLESGYGSPSLDDASRRNLKRLEQGAVKMADEFRPALRALAEKLESA